MKKRIKLLTLAALAVCHLLSPAAAQSGKFQLPPLPYAMNALAPKMSQETLEYHYGKHYKAYIDKLNELIAGTSYENLSLPQIVARAEEGPLYNNAGQALNHQIFFMSLSPRPQPAPTGDLAAAIDRDFGSLNRFKAEFAKTASDLFGSGWAWLASDKSGKLSIVPEPNGGNPVRQGLIPIMGLDVWEHSYYLDYRNDRKKYIDTFWQLIDWKVVEQLYRDR